jgi:hypothetical protein
MLKVSLVINFNVQDLKCALSQELQACVYNLIRLPVVKQIYPSGSQSIRFCTMTFLSSLVHYMRVMSNLSISNVISLGHL